MTNEEDNKEESRNQNGKGKLFHFEYSSKEEKIIAMARELRLAVIQNLYSQGILSEVEAKELLADNLTPGDENSIYDDSIYLNIIEEGK